MGNISHDIGAQRFTLEVDSHRAQLDYTLMNNTMTITHTQVAPAIRGRGFAAMLMAEAVRTADRAGWIINSACSYAAAYLAENSHISSKQHEDDLLDEALEESFPASDSPSVGGVS